jgi:hypothetical protein
LSWLIQRDVDEGHAELNFSEWGQPQEEGGEAAESLREGEMPPRLYTIFRPNRKLSDLEQTGLIRGLEATLGTEEGEEDEEHDDDDDD